jgi:hypothetical protein
MLHITPDGKLHDDADGFALTLPTWPKDAREATQAEIEAIKNKPLNKEEENAPIIAKLAEIDIKSIRAIREYIASKSDAPQFSKDLEAQASVERAKLRK